jgi:hypothetical protein
MRGEVVPPFFFLFKIMSEENTPTPVNKTGPLHTCGGLMTTNPHPEAGLSGKLLEIGCVYECIPCLVKSRHDWSVRALAAEKELRELKEEFEPQLQMKVLKSLVENMPVKITGLENG